jgi:hypothetical protein
MPEVQYTTKPKLRILLLSVAEFRAAYEAWIVSKLGGDL